MNNIKILILWFLLLIISTFSAFATESSPEFSILSRDFNDNDYKEQFNLISGNLALEIMPDSGTLKGSADYLIENPENRPADKIFFGLNPGLEIKKAVISNDFIKSINRENINGDSPLGYLVYPQKAIPPKGQISLRIEFQGKIAANYKFGRIMENDIFLSSGSFFYPRFEINSLRKSQLNVSFTVPAGYIPVTQADNLKAENLPDGKVLFKGKVFNINGLNNDQGINLACAKYQKTGKENLEIYYLGKPDPEFMDYMQNFEEKTIISLKRLFGSHDYHKFIIAEVARDDIGGMGSGNVIFLSDKNFGNHQVKSVNHYKYFKAKLHDEILVKNEFRYYLRNVLAHESVHLFFNYFYTYNKPWFAEGFPEFLSLLALEEAGDKGDINRKLSEYRQALKVVKNNNPIPLNKAELNDPTGYLLNYWGTPLVLYRVRKERGEDFGHQLFKALEKKPGSITYEEIVKTFDLSLEEKNNFEKGFDMF